MFKIKSSAEKTAYIISTAIILFLSTAFIWLFGNTFLLLRSLLQLTSNAAINGQTFPFRIAVTLTSIIVFMFWMINTKITKSERKTRKEALLEASSQFCNTAVRVFEALFFVFLTNLALIDFSIVLHNILFFGLTIAVCEGMCRIFR